MERLAHLFNPGAGDRFLILHGQVHDVFIGQDYTELVWQDALQSWLQNQGFEVVAFSSTDNHISFRDADSRDFVRALATGQLAPRRRGVMQAVNSRGPRGDRILGAPPAPPAVPAYLSDVNSLKTLNVLMRQMQRRCAIVFSDFELLLSHFQDPRTLATTINGWLDLPRKNRNICLWLVEGNLEGLDRLLENRAAAGQPYPQLQQLVHASLRHEGGFQRNKVACIGGPEQAEMERLVDCVRLQNNVACNWKERRRVVQWLAEEGAALGVGAKTWLEQITAGQEVSRSVAVKYPCLTALRERRNDAPMDDKPALVRLDELVGLQVVKQQISVLRDAATEEVRRRESGMSRQVEPPSLHMAFLGNPGTGKTTVAKLIGEIYRDMGLLRRGHTVVVNQANQLIGEYVGHTATRTHACIDRALDGVLFIDEAYQLTDKERGGFGQEAIDALVTRTEDDRDRLLVIVAGYTEAMQPFLSGEANDGLPSRFPRYNHIVFPNYSLEELQLILRKTLKNQEYLWDEDFEEQVREILASMLANPPQGFGNAREVRNLVEATVRHRNARVTRGGLAIDEPVRAEDIDSHYNQFLTDKDKTAVPTRVTDVEDILRDMDLTMVGLTGVKDFVRRRVRRLQFDSQRQQAGHMAKPRALHMVFTGNPGTGKTTVARLMGQVFKTLGLLKSGHVVEVSSPDLIAGYVRQTGPLMQAKIAEALDGVLFIDEAYLLTPNHESDFGGEALGVLNKEMEDKRERLVVIVAGYPQEMREFIATNPGLGSRFTEEINFPDYTPDEWIEILRKLAHAEHYKLSGEAEEVAQAFLQRKREANPHAFGNARDVRNLFEAMQDRLAERFAAEDSGDLYNLTFLAQDVP